MSFCARRLTRHPNQSQALYGVSGKAQPLDLLGSSLGSGDCSSDCDSGAGRAASLAARHHYLCAANITNNMKKTQQQFPRTDIRLKAGKGGKRVRRERRGQLHVQSLVVSFQIEAANKLFQSIRFSSPGITWGSSSIARLDRSIAGQRNFDSLDSLDSSFWDELWPARFRHQLS